MHLVSGYPYWLIRTGLPYQYPKLLDQKNCDVVILGGGISGALTAFQLTEAGLSCVVVDGRAIGLGSTCASTCLLQYELDIPLHQLKKKVGERPAVRAYQLCGAAIDKLIGVMQQIGFEKFGERKSLFFSEHNREKKMMQEECAARKAAGFDVSLLSQDELKDQYGLKAAYGILSAKGATNNSYELTHEIFQYCIKKGLQVFDRSKSKPIEYKKDKVVVTTEEGGQVTAKYAVNATGYEVINFISKNIVNLDSTYAVISEAMDHREDTCSEGVMMWNTNDPYLYLCPTDGNRLILGGRDESFHDFRTLDKLLEKKSRQLEKDYKKLFGSGDFKMEFAWSGVFGKTKDSLPYIGNYKKTPRTFYALGFGGNGITFSQVAAEIIRDLILEKKNPDAAIFSFDR